MKKYQEFIQEAKKCWPGYKKKGTQKLFGKTYNRCVKEDIISFAKRQEKKGKGIGPKPTKTPKELIDLAKKLEKKEEYELEESSTGELEDGLKKLNDTSYDSIDKLMRKIMKKHQMSAKELHNAFVDTHGKIPDEWIKQINKRKK